MRNSIYLFLIIIASCFGCTQSKTDSMSKKSHEVRDDMGRTVSIPIIPKRIISLTPSISELLYTFVDSNRIVGRSNWCDYPDAIKNKPAINSYPLDIEALVRLKPDLILAKKGMISMQEINKLEELKQTVFVQEYDLMNHIKRSARILVDITKGDTATFHQWMDKLQMDTMPKITTKRFLAITSVQPIYVFGTKTFLSQIAESNGGVNCIQSIDNPYPTIDVEYILKANPEVYIFSSEGNKKLFFDTYPILKKTAGYQHNQLFVIADSVMSRPGIRLPVLMNALHSIFNS
jgi:iron complex transport system substrate-binding protein